MGKIFGIILIAGGTIIGIIIAWLGSIYLHEGSWTLRTANLSIVIGLMVLALPQIGFGTFLWIKSSQIEMDLAQVNEQRQLLRIIKTRGQVPLDDLALEMQSTKQTIKDRIHHLVRTGSFSGYINWDKGVLYSLEANKLRNMGHCAHCNGELNLAGKGTIQCPYCDTEYYLE